MDRTLPEHEGIGAARYCPSRSACPAASPSTPGRAGVIRSRSVPAAYLATECLSATHGRLAARMLPQAIVASRQALEAMDRGEIALALIRLGKAAEMVSQVHRALRAGAPGDAAVVAEECERAQLGLIEAGRYRRREMLVEAVLLLASRAERWQLALELPRPAAAARLGETVWIA